jgi:hypothetical protein
MRWKPWIIALALTSSACATTDATRTGDKYRPAIDAAAFGGVIDNPWFPLAPGTTYRYVERHGPIALDVTVTVMNQRKTILGISCVVVHDVLSKNGVTVEDTFDWYAQDRSGNVWYFGEATKEYDDKGHVDTSGSWEAGVRGAQPGIVMPANPLPGPAYRQEYLRGEAEDMAQIIGFTDIVSVPAGKFSSSLETREWSLLEAGSENKWYARGIGFIRSISESGESAELVAVSKAP